MEERKKCSGPCGEWKLLKEYPKNNRMDGYISKCKVCTAKRAKELGRGRRQKTGKIKRISEDNKTFYRLGVSKGEEGINDIKKALVAQLNVNKTLVEIINDADQRDRNTRFNG